MIFSRRALSLFLRQTGGEAQQIPESGGYKDNSEKKKSGADLINQMNEEKAAGNKKY